VYIRRENVTNHSWYSLAAPLESLNALQFLSMVAMISPADHPNVMVSSFGREFGVEVNESALRSERL
jgi:hypothetical protein